MTAQGREQVLALMRRHLSSGMATVATLLGLPVESFAEGSIVRDSDGVEYVDLSGYGVFFLGHRHPDIVAAVSRSLKTQPLATRSMVNPLQIEAAATLAGVAPDGFEKVVFTNSGAEAVDVALKIARANGASHTITTSGGFHGKTLGALSVAGRERYRAPFEPLLGSVATVAFGDLGALEAALRISPGRAAFILEAVQGECGVVIPPAGYLSGAEALCREHGAFLVIDEVQTGLGRLGAWWWSAHEGVTADVLVVGKSLGGGVMPVGAAVTSRAAFELFDRDPLIHSSTFAGGQMAMAAVVASIDVVVRHRLVERADRLGRSFLSMLQHALEGSPVKEVRGLGLLLAIEFSSGAEAVTFVQGMLDEGVLVNHSLNADNVVRLTPAATIDVEQLEVAAAAAGRAAARMRVRAS